MIEETGRAEVRAAAASLAAYIAEHGGATLAVTDRRALRIVDDPYGYVVGIADGTAATCDPAADPLDLYRALLAVAAEFESVHVGAWIDGGRVHIDPVRILTDRETAYRVAREHNQRAVYNLATATVEEVAP